MTSSELKTQIYSYLGFRGVETGSDDLIGSCLAELEKIGQFRALDARFCEPPAFLRKEPYTSFLAGCSEVVLSVTTLGAEVDRRIAYLGRTDMARSVVLDACASAWLEFLADGHEEAFGERTYRFCPGYGGSSIEDIREIFAFVKGEKIGVTLLESNFMLPSKSMAGVIGIGKRMKKSCGACFMLPHCAFRKEGRRCYGSEERS